MVGRGPTRSDGDLRRENRIVAELRQLVRSMPLSKLGHDPRWVVVQFRVAARDAARVEIDRMDAGSGIQFTGDLEPLIKQSLPFWHHVMHQVSDMVEALLPRRVHLPVDGGQIVVLFDELDHHVAEVAEGVRDICFDIRATILEPGRLMMTAKAKRTCAEQSIPSMTRRLQVSDDVRLLKGHSKVGVHRHILDDAPPTNDTRAVLDAQVLFNMATKPLEQENPR